MADEQILLTNNSETIVTQTAETDLVAVTQTEEVIKSQVVEEVLAVKLVDERIAVPVDVVEAAESVPPGRRPFLELPANPGQDVVIDCDKSLTWVVDAGGLTLFTPMQIDIINVPVKCMVLLNILVANVPPGGCAVLWPQPAAGITNTPVGPGLSNEYEVRTWDGGATLHIKRSGWYRVVS